MPPSPTSSEYRVPNQPERPIEAHDITLAELEAASREQAYEALKNNPNVDHSSVRSIGVAASHYEVSTNTVTPSFEIRLAPDALKKVIAERGEHIAELRSSKLANGQDK